MSAKVKNFLNAEIRLLRRACATRLSPGFPSVDTGRSLPADELSGYTPKESFLCGDRFTTVITWIDGDDCREHRPARLCTDDFIIAAVVKGDRTNDHTADSPLVQPDSWESSALQRQLTQGRKLLAVLEEQAAAYTTLTIPAELQVNLENERARVANIERRLAGKAPSLELKELPDWTGDRTLREIMDYLSLFCDESLVNAVMKQVLLSPTYRRSFLWSMTLQPNRQRRRPDDEAIETSLSYSFEQIASSHITEKVQRCYAVYHVPSQLSQRGKLVRLKIDPQGDPTIELRDDELERYADRSAYGCFYRVPYKLERGQSAAVAADVLAFHPARSEEILVSYYPCTDYTAIVRMPLQDAKRFQLRVEFWHPSRTGEWMADEVATQDGFEVSTYRISEPLLPYQGLRIAWHYQ